MAVATATQYDELVREGREAREQADNVQWVEGDLALQIEALDPEDRPRDPETGDFLADPDKALKRYAEDIDVNYRTLQRYRQTAKAWPASARTQASWRTHFQLNALEDRFDVIRPDMTSREAAKVVRDRQPQANYGGEPGWHELLGWVTEVLTQAEKRLATAEAAITRRPNRGLREKAGQYAEQAEAIAARLRHIEAA